MPLSKDLLGILACPQCNGDITLSEGEKGLICENCKLLYPLREGIPILLVEEAHEISFLEGAGSSLNSSDSNKISG